VRGAFSFAVPRKPIRASATAGADLFEALWIKESLSLEVPFQFLQQLPTGARLEAEVFRNHIRKALALLFQSSEDFASFGRDRDGGPRHARTLLEGPSRTQAGAASLDFHCLQPQHWFN